MGKKPELESIVTTQLKEQPTVVLRLAYARKLATTQRLKEAGEQLDAIVAETRNASISYIQRRLKVGYNRAARMVEQMENEGVVGPQEGTKPREVYVSALDG